jgi:ribonuclease D
VNFQDSYTLVNSGEGLQPLLEELSHYEIAAVDTEADSMYHYNVRLCLIQITVGDRHWIVDPLAGLDLSPLFRTRAMQSMIFHGADYDLRMLWNTYHFAPKSVFDTMLAAKLLGEEKLGLANLVEKYFNVTLIKDNQKADWTTRPLPPDMCEYAIHDTSYLHELCAILGEQLQRQGKFGWLMEMCNTVMDHAKCPHEVSPDRWRISGSHYFPPKSLNILKHVWEWREKEAAALDRPPYKVMNPDLMLAIVRSVAYHYPAIDMDSLPRLPRNFTGDRLESFKAAIQSAIDTPESEWPEPPKKPEPPEHAPDTNLLDAIHAWRDEKAAELHFDPVLLGNRTQLVELATPSDKTWEERFEAAHLMNFQKQMWSDIIRAHLSTQESNG